MQTPMRPEHIEDLLTSHYPLHGRTTGGLSSLLLIKKRWENLQVCPSLGSASSPPRKERSSFFSANFEVKLVMIHELTQ